MIRCCGAPDLAAKMGGVCGFKLAMDQKKENCKTVLSIASSLFAVFHMCPLNLEYSTPGNMSIGRRQAHEGLQTLPCTFFLLIISISYPNLKLIVSVKFGP